MPNSLRSNPFLRFLVFSSALYLVWYSSYELYLKPSTRFDEFVIHTLTVASEKELSILGYKTIAFDQHPYHNRVGVEGSTGVVVGSSCDGIVLFALFTIFLVAYPGKWKHKIWFIPAGIFFIWLINSFRITSLALITKTNEEWFAFNHDYTFTILVYFFVFMLWFIWVKKFSPSMSKK